MPNWIQRLMATALTASLLFMLLDLAGDLTAVSWN
jgi:hypothetical protein